MDDEERKKKKIEDEIIEDAVQAEYRKQRIEELWKRQIKRGVIV